MTRPLLVLDHHIRDTCRELMAAGRVSGRALRRALRERYGSAGKTDRVFRVWREETERKSEATRPQLPTDIAELQRRLVVAEEAAKENLARAERAELREQAHQDRWAMEVDRLRQEVQAQPRYAAEIRALQERVHRLTVELHAERQVISENK
jgi:predicted RNase H-like nuclease (RuvC/YqgF family)